MIAPYALFACEAFCDLGISGDGMITMVSRLEGRGMRLKLTENV